MKRWLWGLTQMCRWFCLLNVLITWSIRWSVVRSPICLGTAPARSSFIGITLRILIFRRFFNSIFRRGSLAAFPMWALPWLINLVFTELKMGILGVSVSIPPRFALFGLHIIKEGVLLNFVNFGATWEGHLRRRFGPFIAFFQGVVILPLRRRRPPRFLLLMG